MSGIDPAAVEAAAKAIRAEMVRERPDLVAVLNWRDYANDARAALEAAVPHLRRSLAEEVERVRQTHAYAAGESPARSDLQIGRDHGVQIGYLEAARVVRGKP